MPDYLLLIADREPLLWIVREQRTAFAEHRAGTRPGSSAATASSCTRPAAVSVIRQRIAGG